MSEALPTLAKRLHIAKLAEEEAREFRIALESQISVLIPTDGTQQKTVTLSNGYKLTIQRPLSYKADCNGIQEELASTEFFPPVECKTTFSLDVKGYEWYREHQPLVFALLTKYVTVKPLKVSVNLKSPEVK